MEEQPVISQGAIVAAVSAVLIALVSLGVVSLNDTQLQAIIAAVGALLVIAAPLVGAFWAKPRTAALAKPEDSDGTPLIRASDHEPPALAKAAGRRIVIDSTVAIGEALPRTGAPARMVWSK